MIDSPRPISPAPGSVRSTALVLLLAATTACGQLAGEDIFQSSKGAGPGGGGGSGGAGGDGGGSASSTSSSTSASVSSSTTASSGGSVCGDGVCAPDETAASCPSDCGSSCAHPVCSTGPALADGCDSCVDKVCAADAYCCDAAEGSWDGECVGAADALCGAACCGDGKCDGETCGNCPSDCGACPVGPSCPHTVCFSGSALDPSLCLDPCVEKVCGATPSCCQGNPPDWNAGCQTQAQALCGPDKCVESVCEAMPACCATGWGQACVDLAKQQCSTSCNCAHSVCNQGTKLAATCNPCVAAICAMDAYCCDNSWDGHCVSHVGKVCGVNCNP